MDAIRGTSIAAKEPGQITQWIGASFVPAQVIKQLCGPLLSKFKFQVNLPGLLFIDTPGHETFSNLRRRGGSAADIAVLVIDVAQGLQPQTVESINILKSRKTPFLVVANKVDLIPGWKKLEGLSFHESYSKQRPEVQTEVDNRIYSLMGALSRLGFAADRYDSISEFTKTVAIVPASGKTREGLADLLAMLIGLTQAFMKEELLVTSGPAKGTILEVEEEPGLGITMNTILYDGILKVNDEIVAAGREGPIATTVRAILLPKPLEEIRESGGKFSGVESVAAAAGVKIAAPNLENVLAGSSIYVVPKGEDMKKFMEMVREEVESVKIKTDKLGVVLKADTLGSLEALITSLTSSQIPIRLADVGDISKREVIEAETVRSKERLYGAVLAFNVKTLPDAEAEAKAKGTPIFKSNIIYHLLEEYLNWLGKERSLGVKAELEIVVRPGRVRLIPGFVFRRSKPAIVGVEVQAGRVRPKYMLINEKGVPVGEVQRIQNKGQDISEATRGMEVAISIDKPTVGRQVNEGETLYVLVPERDVKTLQLKFREQISQEEIDVMNALIKIMRQENPIWAL